MTRPDVLPRATEHIDEIVALIETLLERGHAYRTDDGSIFFRIASWPAYGQLARLDPEQLRVGERVEADEYAKDDVRDFALWKGAKPGEPSWSTAIGEGRPGWHIECSAMSMAHLGPSFDLHTGGVDLIFPHHEDEIAQSEAATGQPFVGTWLHCAHLQMGGEKMAKSTGNIARVGELLEAGVSPRALRYALIAVHYRAALNHSDDVARRGRRGARAARRGDRRPRRRIARSGRTTRPCPMSWRPSGRRSAPPSTTTSTCRPGWPPCSTSSARPTDGSRRAACRPPTPSGSSRPCATSTRCWASWRRSTRRLPPDLVALLDERAAARAARDWAASDRLRDELAERGVLVEDTRDGQRWRRDSRRRAVADRPDDERPPPTAQGRGPSGGGPRRHGPDHARSSLGSARAGARVRPAARVHGMDPGRDPVATAGPRRDGPPGRDATARRAAPRRAARSAPRRPAVLRPPADDRPRTTGPPLRPAALVRTATRRTPARAVARRPTGR